MARAEFETWHGKVLPSAGGDGQRGGELEQGFSIETARTIVKLIKELKIKKLESEIRGSSCEQPLIM